VRTIGGTTGRGFFRTFGAASTTIVRRGAWTTTDRCDGTLTQVRRGTATVVPRHGRPVRVRAGQGYFVPANFLTLDSPRRAPRSARR
jgi:hypothetical protein